MAKSKKKAKAFLPKTIAGVRVPKQVRKGRFGELLASPSGQKVIAEAIMAAGALAAGKKAAGDPQVRAAAKAAKDKVAGTIDGTAHGGADAGGALAYALTEAARSFAQALRSGGPAEPRSFRPADPAGSVASTGPTGEERDDVTEKQPPAHEHLPL